MASADNAGVSAFWHQHPHGVDVCDRCREWPEYARVINAEQHARFDALEVLIDRVSIRQDQMETRMTSAQDKINADVSSIEASEASQAASEKSMAGNISDIAAAYDKLKSSIPADVDTSELDNAVAIATANAGAASTDAAAGQASDDAINPPVATPPADGGSDVPVDDSGTPVVSSPDPLAPADPNAPSA